MLITTRDIELFEYVINVVCHISASCMWPCPPKGISLASYFLGKSLKYVLPAEGLLLIHKRHVWTYDSNSQAGLLRSAFWTSLAIWHYWAYWESQNEFMTSLAKNPNPTMEGRPLPDTLRSFFLLKYTVLDYMEQWTDTVYVDMEEVATCFLAV